MNKDNARVVPARARSLLVENLIINKITVILRWSAGASRCVMKWDEIIMKLRNTVNFSFFKGKFHKYFFLVFVNMWHAATAL